MNNYVAAAILAIFAITVYIAIMGDDLSLNTVGLNSMQNLVTQERQIP